MVVLGPMSLYHNSIGFVLRIVTLVTNIMLLMMT